MVDPPPAPSTIGPKAAWWAWLRRLYAVVVLVVLGYLFWQVPDAIRVLSARASDAGAWMFVLAWALMASSLGVLWAVGLRMIAGCRLGLLETLQVQGGAWAGRYLPGKVGLLAGKLVLADRRGLDARTLAASVIFEQLAFIAAGVAVAAACLDPTLLDRWLGPGALAPVAGPGFRAVAVAMAIALAIAAAWVAIRTAGAGRVAALAPVALLYLLPHAVCGLGLAALSKAGGLEVSLVDAVGAMALANVAGVLAVFAPAGLGVREAVLVAVLPAQDPAAIVAFVAMVRILATLGDALFIAIGLSAGALRARFQNSEAGQ